MDVKRFTGYKMCKPVTMCFIILCSQLPLELSLVDMSAVSVRAGLLSVLAVLPAAAVVCFLFRLREVKMMGSRSQRTKGRMPENYCSEGGFGLKLNPSAKT